MPLRTRDEQLLATVRTQDETLQISALLTSLAAFVVLFCLGATLTFFAYRQLWINWAASSEPVEVSLLELEKGRELPDHHLKIDEHISMASDRVLDTYPIFSTAGTPIEDYIDSTAGNEYDASLEQLKFRMRKVRILVRNHRGPRKSGIRFESGIEGLIVGRASQLDVDEHTYTRLNIKNPENIYILEAGRKPNSVWGILMAVLSILFFLGAGFFVIPFVKSLSKFGYD